jgi:hypothetical protein
MITLTSGLENQIPDRSWMLYLLEVFNSQNIAVELNLISQFDGQDYFEAIFNGINQYRFKKISPLLGHPYMRQIIFNAERKSISYVLEDKMTGDLEGFQLHFNNNNFIFEGVKQFTGIEWWNRIGHFPYPIRYKTEICHLMYGLRNNASDFESIFYWPYHSLTPNSEGHSHQYPIFFNSPFLKDGCICYSVTSGTCTSGLRYNC